MALRVPAMHLNHANKEHGEERDEENGKGQEMFEGEVAHKCQPCSTSNDTIVKSRLSQTVCHFRIASNSTKAEGERTDGLKFG
jgi:hypothetical protein